MELGNHGEVALSPQEWQSVYASKQFPEDGSRLFFASDMPGNLW